MIFFVWSLLLITPKQYLRKYIHERKQMMKQLLPVPDIDIEKSYLFNADLQIYSLLNCAPWTPSRLRVLPIIDTHLRALPIINTSLTSLGSSIDALRAFVLSCFMLLQLKGKVRFMSSLIYPSISFPAFILSYKAILHVFFFLLF